MPYASIDILLSSYILIKNSWDSQWNMSLVDKYRKQMNDYCVYSKENILCYIGIWHKKSCEP